MGRSTSTVSGRPDDKVASNCSLEGQNGLICFAIPNAKTPTYKHQEEVKRNLVDGYIENGVEIDGSLSFLLYGSTYDGTYTILGSSANTYPFQFGDKHIGKTVQVKGDSGGYYKGVIINAYSVRLDTLYGDVSTNFTDNNATYYEYIRTTKSPYLATQGSQTHTDLIGDPANYPQDLLNVLASGKGVGFMNALLVGQDGSAYTITANQYPIVSKKKHSDFQHLYADGNYNIIEYSGTIGDVNNNVSSAINLTTNKFYILNYQAKNQPAISIPTPQPIEVVDRDLIASNSHSVYAYNGLTYGASGKVATGSSVEAKGVEDVVQDENKDISTTPTHNTLTLDNQSIVASKALVTQTANATQVFTQEMVWDSVNSDWGDTNQFDQLTSGTTPNLDAVDVQTKVLLKPSSIKIGE